jgi:hypothetical protein
MYYKIILTIKIFVNSLCAPFNAFRRLRAELEVGENGGREKALNAKGGRYGKSLVQMVRHTGAPFNLLSALTAQGFFQLSHRKNP